MKTVVLMGVCAAALLSLTACEDEPVIDENVVEVPIEDDGGDPYLNECPRPDNQPCK